MKLDKVSLQYGNVKYPLAFLDIEVFEKYWLVKIKINGVFHSFDSYLSTPETRLMMKRITKSHILVSFNGKHYDLKILKAIESGFDTHHIKMLSDAIVTEDPNNPMACHNNYSFWQTYSFIDLMDDFMGSLKEYEANCFMDIRETTVDFNITRELTKKEIEEVNYYCEHDVNAAERLFEDRFNYVAQKLNLIKIFPNLHPIEVLKSTNAKLTEKILIGDKYVTPIDNSDQCFKIPMNVAEYLKTWCDPELLTYYTTTPVGKIKTYKIKAFENKINLGSGGIHSVYAEDLILEEDENYVIVNIDVESYYPSMIIKYDYISDKVTDKTLFPNIKERRVQAKANKHIQEEREISDGLKLVLNTESGAAKNKYNKLYDPLANTSMCTLGQLMLFALAHEIWAASTPEGKIIQTNTDGIMVYIPRKYLPYLKETVSRWEETTGMKMEYEYVKKMVQKNVNNYIEIQTNGKIKVKGGWVGQYEYTPLTGPLTGLNNLKAPIAQEAVFKLLTKGIPIEKTIRECRDVYKFCFTVKTGWTYKQAYHYLGGEQYPINKVNRVVCVDDNLYGTIKKYKQVKDKKTGFLVDRYDKAANISEHVKLVNDDLSNYKIDDLNLDLKWYIDYANHLLFSKVDDTEEDI